MKKNACLNNFSNDLDTKTQNFGNSLRKWHKWETAWWRCQDDIFPGSQTA